MRPDIAPGGTFPDYELPEHTNVSRRLTELQGDDPLILTLARSHVRGPSARRPDNRQVASGKEVP
jgi:hypothetical protein